MEWGRVSRNLLRGLLNSLALWSPPGKRERDSKAYSALGPQRPVRAEWGRDRPVTRKSRLALEESWRPTSSGWGCVGRRPAPPPHSPAIHRPDPHGHLDRCHCSSRPGPRGAPPAQVPATASDSRDSARCSLPLPSSPPPLRSSLDLTSRGGPTCQATEHAQSGSDPRDPRAGLGSCREAPRGGAGLPGRRRLKSRSWEGPEAGSDLEVTEGVWS